MNCAEHEYLNIPNYRFYRATRSLTRPQYPDKRYTGCKNVDLELHSELTQKKV